jgi:hypothetical protein
MRRMIEWYAGKILGYHSKLILWHTRRVQSRENPVQKVAADSRISMCRIELHGRDEQLIRYRPDVPENVLFGKSVDSEVIWRRNLLRGIRIIGIFPNIPNTE